MNREKNLLLYLISFFVIACFFFLYLFLKNLPQAYQLEKKTKKKSTYSFSSQLHQANVFYNNSRFKDALIKIQETEEKTLSAKQKYIIQIFQASCYKSLGLYQTALARIETALKNKENPFAYFLRATIYKKLGVEKKSIEDLTKSYKLDPFFSPAYEILGDIYFQKQDYEWALEAYSGMGNYKRNPVSGATLLKKALCYFLLNQSELTLISVDEYLKKIKDRKYLFLAYFLKALSYPKNNSDQVKEFFELSLQYAATRDIPILYYYYALFLIQENEYSEAIDKLKQLARSDYYSDKFIDTTLGNIYLHLKNYKKSYQYFNKGKKDDLSQSYNLALSAYKIKKYRVAIKNFDEILLANIKDEYHLSAYVLTALSYFYLAEIEEAQRVINSALIDYGDNPYLVKVLGYIIMKSEPESFFDKMNVYFEKPEFEELNLLLSDYYLKNQEYHLSLSILMEYIQKNTKYNSEIDYNLAWLNQKLNSYQDASYYYQKAYKRSTDNFDKLISLNNLALINTFLMGFSAGRSTLMKGNQIESKNPALLYNDAILHKSFKKYPQYQQTLNKAFKLKDNYQNKKFLSLLYFEMGSISEEQNNISAARRYYKKALEYNPSNELFEYHYKKL